MPRRTDREGAGAPTSVFLDRPKDD